VIVLYEPSDSSLQLPHSSSFLTAHLVLFVVTRHLLERTKRRKADDETLAGHANIRRSDFTASPAVAADEGRVGLLAELGSCVERREEGECVEGREGFWRWIEKFSMRSIRVCERLTPERDSRVGPQRVDRNGIGEDRWRGEPASVVESIESNYRRLTSHNRRYGRVGRRLDS
jgi:hypothetical protein